MEKTVNRPEEFQCAMCKKFFKYSWSEEEEIAEAKANGFNHYDYATVCDDCYDKTPWGTETL